MKLKRDIPQLMDRQKLYGHAGEEVKIVGAVTVEKKDGSRFPVKAEDLEENTPPLPSEKPDKNKKPNSKTSLF
jgi:hypothetical protein